MIRQFINGICMALADSVPGVSGGNSSCRFITVCRKKKRFRID